MSRPEDIPDSVWGVARGCIEAREFNVSHPKNTVARIARAIMAERERCALIAEARIPLYGREGQNACREIASSIRAVERMPSHLPTPPHTGKE